MASAHVSAHVIKSRSHSKPRVRTKPDAVLPPSELARDQWVAAMIDDYRRSSGAAPKLHSKRQHPK